MRAIRIIRTPERAPPPDVPSISRDEQMRLVSDVLAESLHANSRERLDACLTKLHNLYDGIDCPDDTASHIDRNIHLASNPMAVHADIDISRILELLED